MRKSNTSGSKNFFSYSELLQDIKYLNYTRHILFEEQDYFRQICYWLGIENSEKVADLGCGTGYITNRLRTLYPNTEFIGFDKDPYYILHAKDSYKYEKNISFVETDLSKEIPVQNNYFNICFSFAAIHQFNNFYQTLKECYRVINARGKIVLFIPIDECPQSKSLDEYYPNQKNISQLEKELFYNYIRHVDNFIFTSRGITWREAPNVLKEIGFTNILIKGMFTPYCPENNDICEYLELLHKLWRSKMEFIKINFSRVDNLEKFKKLEKEYNEKYQWFINELENNRFFYSWGGAPLLIIKGTK